MSDWRAAGPRQRGGYATSPVEDVACGVSLDMSSLGKSGSAYGSYREPPSAMGAYGAAAQPDVRDNPREYLSSSPTTNGHGALSALDEACDRLVERLTTRRSPKASSAAARSGACSWFSLVGWDAGVYLCFVHLACTCGLGFSAWLARDILTADVGRRRHAKHRGRDPRGRGGVLVRAIRRDCPHGRSRGRRPVLRLLLPRLVPRRFRRSCVPGVHDARQLLHRRLLLSPRRVRRRLDLRPGKPQGRHASRAPLRVRRPRHLLQRRRLQRDHQCVHLRHGPGPAVRDIPVPCRCWWRCRHDAGAAAADRIWVRRVVRGAVHAGRRRDLHQGGGRGSRHGREDRQEHPRRRRSKPGGHRGPGGRQRRRLRRVHGRRFRVNRGRDPGHDDPRRRPRQRGEAHGRGGRALRVLPAGGPRIRHPRLVGRRPLCAPPRHRLEPAVGDERGYAVTAVLAIGFFTGTCRVMLYTESAPSAWFSFWMCGMIGILTSFVLLFVCQYYTDYAYPPVRAIAAASLSGHGTNVIQGLAVGFESTGPPAIVVSCNLAAAYYLGESAFPASAVTSGLFGTAVATMGILCTAVFILSMNNFGPIADNAGGIVEMSGQSEEARTTTDSLDAVGNVTKAATKGYSVGASAMAFFLLFRAFMDDVEAYSGEEFKEVNLAKIEVLIGGLLGVAMIFVFTGWTMTSVGVTAQAVVEEVRRQFAEFPGIMYALSLSLSRKRSRWQKR
ncbi:Pyrophosphate-energized membrane proton pump 3 [Diplonema papillatum]|nr:Pyrophosphate-energized membrane proton pump 3 [Diplonema papillatum]